VARTETRLFNWTVTFGAAGIFNLDVNVSCYRIDTGAYVEVHGYANVYVDVHMPNYTRSYLPHEWVGSGTPMNWHGDDQCWQRILPFDFPFCGVTYRTIHISSNGLVTFSAPDTSCANSIQNLASKLAIAVAWDDWKTDYPYDIYIWQNSTHAGIRWYAMAYANADVFCNFEAILGVNGRIQLNYGQNDGAISATIGISNGQGLFIAEDVTNLGYVDTVVFTPIDSNPPVISDPLQEPDPNHVTPDDSVTVSANVTDLESEVSGVVLSYTTDDGASWENVTMNESIRYNSTTALYAGTIPNKPYGTWVRYKITAYDTAGNSKEIDNAEAYYVYQVIPEFFSLLPLTTLIILTTTLLLARKYTRRQKVFA
jgi:hypothetical protein